MSSRSLSGEGLLAAIDQAVKLGASGLEVSIEDIWHHDESPRWLASVAHRLGLEVSAYAPTKSVNIIAPDPSERERSMRWAVEAVATTRELGATILTIQPGHLVSGQQTLASGWRPLISAARTLAWAAVDQGIRVAIENLSPAPDRVLTHLVDAQSLMREVDSPHLGICLNVSYLSLSDEAPVDWLGGLDRVFQIRVSPDRPRRTLQPVLGLAKERALFVERLEAAGYQGQVVLDDPQLVTDRPRLMEELTQVSRWFNVRKPVTSRRSA